ncbi:glycosyltransferase 87 family protein [Amycolatopsis sp. CA-230715]|uniref:glycosyltransferase 87 family protein n=1 Tax=Amycolatopsis sp. CA-230715 TaxID=2745196 RepID=UPI001C0227D4|nr:glycosyltransferase 87 family protein [Amycolatopsis sp. CA-230715]QWF79291.1 Polyprenol-phosphate-mannose-dependent alpha-(1-2)-phosphatidylinositol mannoside mannosyltransferase [Amycolatopsis sp. CA-230715]
MSRSVPTAVNDGQSTVRAPHRLALRASLARLSARPRSVLLLAAVPVLAIVFGVVAWLLDWRIGVDSAVYRAGALTLLHGDPLYDANTLATEPWWALLPFTYPPSAALFFVPMALVPIQVAWGVLTAVSVLAMALVVRIAIGSLPPPKDGGARWWASPARATLVFSLVFLGLEPVWRTIFLGQINLILMAMVVLDVLVITARGSRWGGVLVGIASAVKLTPLPFIAHLLFTGKVKDAFRALGTFVAFQGLMFAIIPGQTLRFWTQTLKDTGRIGPLHWAGNQSLNGMLNRITDLAPWSSTAAIGLALVLAVPAIWLMLRFHRKGQPLAALLVTAFWVLLASPVSWSHHWVWAVPLIVLLISRLPQTTPATAWRRWAGAIAVIAVFVSCVLLAMPNGRNIELHWVFWQNVLGNAYLLMPLVLAAVLTVRWLILRRRRAAAPAEPPSDEHVDAAPAK